MSVNYICIITTKGKLWQYTFFSSALIRGVILMFLQQYYYV